MPDLLIHIKKKTDGSAALRCTRADGSVTWQRQDGAQGRFFPLHDLTHYAVETVLHHRRGFYGLVSEGWDITDFGAPWPRGPIPSDADPSEVIVGFLDVERAGGVEWSLQDFNDKLAAFHADRARATPAPLNEDDLTTIRKVRDQLFVRWLRLAAGGTIELAFNCRPDGDS